MTKIRKTYTREFKLEALQLVKTSGKSISQIERDLGLSQGTLFHWRQQFTQQPTEAFPGHGRLSATDEHVRQLERENNILRQERDILKKAIAVLTPKPQ
jgi:transposase